jgi:Zn-dependent protease with chaperone function
MQVKTWLGFVVVLGMGAAEAAAERRKFEGYAEWRREGGLVVDGQRVRAVSTTEFKGRGEAKSVDTIPLGYEVKVDADRAADGSWTARKIEARPNESAMFEADLQNDFNELESRFRRAGHVFEEDEDGTRTEDYGRLLTHGRQVARVQRIVDKIVPPYFDEDGLRVYVVENEDWNAMAAPNGSIFVFTGLLENTSDDELAVILGHELAHVTHEHSRREMKKGLWSSLFMLGALGLAEEIDSDGGRLAASALAVVGGLVMQSRYSRHNEDQADRVGLRYAHEGGYDVSAAPHLWERFAAKYGDLPKAVNFFLGDHSRSKDRATTMARELQQNYTVAVAAAR